MGGSPKPSFLPIVIIFYRFGYFILGPITFLSLISILRKMGKSVKLVGILLLFAWWFISDRKLKWILEWTWFDFQESEIAVYY